MKHDELIRTLNECTVECYNCAAECLREEDVKTLAKCIELDLDCAGSTKFAAELAARKSRFLKKQLQVCVETCAACAEECEKHASKMDHCKKCAEACRKCEAACKEIL